MTCHTTLWPLAMEVTLLFANQTRASGLLVLLPLSLLGWLLTTHEAPMRDGFMSVAKMGCIFLEVLANSG